MVQTKLPPKRTPPSKTVEKLDIQAEFQKLQAMYEEDETSNKINILLLGESGSGKTFLMRTAPQPVHVDSFDPGGGKCLRSMIKPGEIIMDSRWEKENPWDPKQFRAWETEMERRISIGYFDHIKTYMLDSATTWSMAVMNQILKQAGIPGQNPRFTHDYGPQKVAIQNWTKRLLNLPCNVIITGHLKTDRDEISGSLEKRFMTTGQAAVIIPLLFDEIWVMSPKKTSGGTNFRILLQSTGTNLARSRLAEDGKLAQYEEPNLINMLKKAGMIV